MARDPDLDGPGGRAWRIDLAHVRTDSIDQQATLAAYTLDCPQAHPLWHWYLAAVVHLRPIEGAEAPNIVTPGATHELLVVAHNPEQPDPDPDDPNTFQWLLPPDLTHQFVVPEDGDARGILDAYVHAVVDNGFSPDSDWRSLWREMIDRTAEHVRLGQHPERSR